MTHQMSKKAKRRRFIVRFIEGFIMSVLVVGIMVLGGAIECGILGI